MDGDGISGVCESKVVGGAASVELAFEDSVYSDSVVVSVDVASVAEDTFLCSALSTV